MTGIEHDQEFWDLADSFIRIANEHSESVRATKVSAALLYAAARFNTFVAACQTDSGADFSRHRQDTLEYFLREYRTMLSENIDEYERNFDEYVGRPES
jgi:hypothetical protein